MNQQFDYEWQIEAANRDMRARGVMRPKVPDPDEGTKRQAGHNPEAAEALDEITLDEWRKRVDRSWNVFKLD